MSQWYVQRPGSSNVHGPYSFEHVHAAIASGRLPQSYFVSCETRTQGWQTVADVFGLRTAPLSGPIARAEPPPPPEPELPALAEQPTPPELETAIHSLDTVGAGRVKLLGKQPQRGQWLLLLLDFRLQYYLTPWIIRAAWMLALVFAGCQLLLLTVMLISYSGIASEPDHQPSAAGAVPFQWPPEGAAVENMPDFGRGRAAREAPAPANPAIASRTADSVRAISLRLAIWLLGIWFVLMGLLTIRVICELVIVIFNIADSLMAIDRNTKTT